MLNWVEYDSFFYILGAWSSPVLLLYSKADSFNYGMYAANILIGLR